MTPNAKLLAGQALCPIIADLIEDAVEAGIVRFKSKQEANRLVDAIRRFDAYFMDNAPAEAVEQQIDIQIALRNWIETNFTETDNESE